MVNKGRTLMISAGTLGAGLLLAGCSQAQQALDSAQSIINSAQVLVQACSDASIAWSPDASVAEATAGLQSAVSSVDAALAENPSLPGATNLLSSLQSALADLKNIDNPAAQVASITVVQSACNLVSG